MLLDYTKDRERIGVRITATATAFPTDSFSGKTPGKYYSNADIRTLVSPENDLDDAGAKEPPSTHDRLSSNHVESLGFLNRYWVRCPGDPLSDEYLTAADLMLAAAQSLLSTSAASKVASNEIDLVITVTTTSSTYTSSNAPSIAHKLGLSCAAFEIKNGCAGGIYAMNIASQYIQAGARHVLILAGETYSKVTALHSPHLFSISDGGGAALISADTDLDGGSAVGPQHAFLAANGAFADAIGVRGSLPPTQQCLDNDDYLMTLGHGGAAMIEQAWSEIPQRLYDAAHCSPNEIDRVITNQVNLKILSLIGTAAQVEFEKVENIIGNIANCGAVGFIASLDNAMQTNSIGSGNRALLAAVGGGLAWGGMLWKF